LLYEQLDLADAEPLEGGLRWLIPGLVAAAAASGALLFYLVGQSLFAGLFLAGFVAMLVAAFVIDRRAPASVEIVPLLVPDLELVGMAMGLSADAAALSDEDGKVQAINPSFKVRFGAARAPFEVGENEEAGRSLMQLRDTALRDGVARIDDLPVEGGSARVQVSRVGARKNLLLWQFGGATQADPIDVAAKSVAGATGERLASAGILAALVDKEGQLVAANRPFAQRALGGAPSSGHPPSFGQLVETSQEGQLRLVAEGPDGRPLRGVHLPLDPDGEGGAGTFLMFEANEGAGLANSTNVQVLLEMLPIGLALVDRDGRFLTMNNAFRTAGGLKAQEMPA
jgi:two-component system cell cycle sensor histidine kinase/response regulator CckA